MEKARGRQIDRRRPTHDGGERTGARLMAELVADSLKTDDGDTTGGSGRTIRVYRLFNRCSTKFVRVAGKRVDAAASDDDIYSA